MTGVQSLNNFSFEEGGLRAWRAYNIGPGKFYTRALLARFATPQGATTLQIIQSFGRPSVEVGTFMATITVPPSFVQPSTLQLEPANHSEEEVQDEDRVHFACPQEGCIKVYQSFSALQKHLDVGKHLRKLEHETPYDQVKWKWAETCLSLSGGYVQAAPSMLASATTAQPTQDEL